MVSRALEDYLKAVYELHRQYEVVPTTALAERLELAPASVTGMAKKMAEMGLLTHQPYQGVVLSENGLSKALRIIRIHRLAELYMVRMLGIPWDRVHEEAEKWEHILSEDLEERIDTLLGRPVRCPHGSPIPDKDGTIATPPNHRLIESRLGQSAIIEEVDDRDEDLLRYFGELGLFPGVRISVVRVAPAASLIEITINGKGVSLGREAADRIYVSVLE